MWNKAIRTKRVYNLSPLCRWLDSDLSTFLVGWVNSVQVVKQDDGIIVERLGIKRVATTPKSYTPLLRTGLLQDLLKFSNCSRFVHARIGFFEPAVRQQMAVSHRFSSLPCSACSIFPATTSSVGVLHCSLMAARDGAVESGCSSGKGSLARFPIA